MTEEVKNCPQCKQPAHSKRHVRGVPNLICGNGHNWPQFQEPKPAAPTEDQCRRGFIETEWDGSPKRRFP
jgi:hypothetical protein